MATFLLWAGIFVTLGGIANLWYVLSSHREGDHPTCKTCGYDLRTIWKRVVQCPECGGDVRTVRWGSWRPNWWLAIGPIVLICFGVAMTCVGVLPKLGTKAPLPVVKTPAILLTEATGYDRVKAATAIRELQRRHAAGLLSQIEAIKLETIVTNAQRVDQLVRMLERKPTRPSEEEAALLLWTELIDLGIDAPKPNFDRQDAGPEPERAAEPTKNPGD